MNACDSCHGGCCRNLLLTITVFDVFRIAEALALENNDICEFAPTKHTKESAKEDAECLIKLTDTKKYPYHILKLKTRASREIKDGRQCIFLVEGRRSTQPLSSTIKSHPGHSIYGKCGIYENRPTMCRAYPFTWDSEEYTIIARNMRNVSAPEPGEELCPEEWPLPNTRDEVEHLSDITMKERREHHQFKWICSGWNERGGGSKEEFFKYCKGIIENSPKKGPEENPGKANLLTVLDIYPWLKLAKAMNDHKENKKKST